MGVFLSQYQKVEYEQNNQEDKSPNKCEPHMTVSLFHASVGAQGRTTVINSDNSTSTD